MPPLRLSPASLGHPMVLQQRLTVSANGQSHRFEVLLEADAQTVRLAVLGLSQTAVRLAWDGRRLAETRAAGWPAAVTGERILGDLQLVLWPDAAIRAALPPGWTLDAGADARVLRHHGYAVVSIAYPSPARAELAHERLGYRLDIESHALREGEGS